ncbi:hypothetical protein BXZ70DRAFT_198291 [Cristinia sonorae]|uniref:Uncharacterized protein n=1 Tax=Cristinia sonorae TaxID=1940300 RepID=A0A8K0XPJ0_9AGAR|nr:hypothetical protein BXZ70DRAFT_198291 [Cristinia sonorae]
MSEQKQQGQQESGQGQVQQEPQAHEVIDLTNIDSDSESEVDADNEYADVAPLDENAHTQLHMVISSLNQALLRQIIADLVDEEPYVARALYDRLTTELDQDDDEEEEEEAALVHAAPQEGEAANPAGSQTSSVVGEEEDDGPPPSVSSEPVPAARTVWTCVNCDGEFDPDVIGLEGECNYHPGHLEADETKFVDWDEDVHGPMDTPENRRDYPENFTWTCCNEDGVSEGCRDDVHQKGGSSNKRARR